MSITHAPVAARRPTAARAAVACLAGLALATVVAGVAHPGYDHLREGNSALAATDSPSAPVMIAGFVALAVGTLAAGVALWNRLRVGVAGRIGASLVLLAGAGMVVVAFAQQDCSDLAGACAAAEEAGTLSGHHVVHQLVSLAVYLLPAVASLPLARGLKRSGGWAHLAVPTRLVGLVAVLMIAALVVVGFGDMAGLVQRGFILLVFGWPVLLAIRSPRW